AEEGVVGRARLGTDPTPLELPAVVVRQAAIKYKCVLTQQHQFGCEDGEGAGEYQDDEGDENGEHGLERAGRSASMDEAFAPPRCPQDGKGKRDQPEARMSLRHEPETSCSIGVRSRELQRQARGAK